MKAILNCSICGTPVRVNVVYPHRSPYYNLDLRGKYYKDDLRTLEKMIVRCPVCGLCLLQPDFGDFKLPAAYIESYGYRSMLNEKYFPETVNGYRCACYLYRQANDDVKAAFCSIRASWVCDSLKLQEQASKLRLVAWRDYKFLMHRRPKNVSYFNNFTLTTIDLSRRTRHFGYCIRMCVRAMFTGNGWKNRIILLYEIQSCLRKIDEERMLARVAFSTNNPFLWLKLKFKSWNKKNKRKAGN